MGSDRMSEHELVVFLKTIADLVEVKAKDAKEAAEIIREKANEIRAKKK